ncbi:hypothetical protein EF879_23530 [Micromonospora sp. HM5-17]|nr:hypothetical protein EF879_23530 [Micromonospora sp. HM5-17]
MSGRRRRPPGRRRRPGSGPASPRRALPAVAPPRRRRRPGRVLAGARDSETPRVGPRRPCWLLPGPVGAALSV